MTTYERLTRDEIAARKREIIDSILLVDVHAAAEALSVSQETVYRMVREGEIHAYTRNLNARGMRFLARELQDYVRSIKVERDRWRE